MCYLLLNKLQYSLIRLFVVVNEDTVGGIHEVTLSAEVIDKVILLIYCTIIS